MRTSVRQGRGDQPHRQPRTWRGQRGRPAPASSADGVASRCLCEFARSEVSKAFPGRFAVPPLAPGDPPELRGRVQRLAWPLAPSHFVRSRERRIRVLVWSANLRTQAPPLPWRADVLCRTCGQASCGCEVSACVLWLRSLSCVARK
eukprot:6167905-Pleurochrysis_carterae.AAC.1